MSIDQSRPWWLEYVCCPDCGAPLTETSACVCGRRFQLRRNVLQWTPDPRITPTSTKRTWSNTLATLGSPLRTPLLPFRYLTQHRLERYYERTVHDAALAAAWASHYLRALPLPPGATVLDFGCGRGRHTGILNQLGYRTVGQDLTDQPWWSRLPQSGFQAVPDGSRLPWQDGAFDLVVEVGVIHYIPSERVQPHASEISRVLKPGGHWLLLEANAEGYGARYVAQQVGSLHSIDGLRKCFGQVGFTEVDVSYEGFLSPLLPAAVDYMRKQGAPRPLDLADFDSKLAAMSSPTKRRLWLMRLRKPETPSA